ncbi:MAG: hypothetical protein JWO76_913 [Nocardioides sp.]|nr:hypothetical protein [Nocardioides sp.]
MKRTWVAVFLMSLLMSSVLGTWASAWAGDGTHANPTTSGFLVTGLDTANADSGGIAEPTAAAEGHWISHPLCAFGGSATCVDVLRCEDGTPMVEWVLVGDDGQEISRYRYCPDSGSVAVAPQVTPGMVLRALRRIDLPQSQLIVQPPGGETLVNFATNFYTEQGQLTRTVHLLGQRVDLKIWPSQFGWRFGDGRSLATESAGSPYPDLEITHEYAKEGGVRPSVDTTYAAQFRVNGGPWRDVNGTVTIPGSPVQLRVRTASPILVGYH